MGESGHRVFRVFGLEGHTYHPKVFSWERALSREGSCGWHFIRFVPNTILSSFFPSSVWDTWGNQSQRTHSLRMSWSAISTFFLPAFNLMMIVVKYPWLLLVFPERNRKGILPHFPRNKALIIIWDSDLGMERWCCWQSTCFRSMKTLVWIPSTHVRQVGVVQCLCNPGNWEWGVDRHISRALSPAISPLATGECWVQWETVSKEKWRMIKENTSLASSLYTQCMYMH